MVIEPSSFLSISIPIPAFISPRVLLLIISSCREDKVNMILFAQGNTAGPRKSPF